MSRGSLFSVRTVDVVGNALPTLASLSDRFGGGSVMVWGGISHGLKSPLIVIAGYLTGVRYRDENPPAGCSSICATASPNFPAG
jgi:hypothetical protein